MQENLCFCGRGMMKEFEIWNKKEYPLPACYERGPIRRHTLAQRKAAWRGALEWVKTKRTAFDVILSECIEEELGGEEK